MYIQIALPVLVIVQVINENNEHDTNYTTNSSLYLMSPTLCQRNMNIVVCGCALLSSFTATKGQRTQKELWQRNKLMQSY